MSDFTARCPRPFQAQPLPRVERLLERLLLRLVLGLLTVLLPARGRHRASSDAALPPAPQLPCPSPSARRPVRTPLPRHKSPYAQDAVARRPFVDVPNSVRRYVLAPPDAGLDSPELRAQAERRWVLDMALRGIDVGPTTIHGVHLRPDSRAVQVMAA